MDPSSRQYTAFTTPDGGTFHFKRLPFGLKNAPACFQRLMTQQVLDGLIGDICIIYLDDILIFSRTWDEHVTHVALVLERLQHSGLTVSLKKCQFGRASLEYLGHVITADGNFPMEKHFRAIKDREPPRNKKQLQSFLGTCNWLREFVPNAATVLAPLCEHLKNSKWSWTDEDTSHFTKAKDAFSKIQMLSRPDFSGTTFYLQTDASEVGLGAVLFQYAEDNSKRVISFASAKLSPTESRYSSNERECLAVVWAIKKYRIYLEDQPFVLRTDNQSLKWLNKFSDSKAKLTRWAILLSELSFKIEHCPGRDTELADALSRFPDAPKDMDTEDWERMELPRLDTHHSTHPTAAAVEPPSLANVLRQGQSTDSSCQELIRAVLNKSAGDNYSVERDLLMHRAATGSPWKIVVPPSKISAVIRHFHDDPLVSHPGEAVTFDLINRLHYWKTARSDVKQYVSSCSACARNKTSGRTTKTDLLPRVPVEVWDTLALDLMGPYPRSKSGKTYLIVVTDLFSRWVEAKAVSSGHTKQIIQFLDSEIFPRFGYCTELLSDNGPQFTGTLWKQACARWQVTHHTTAPYHPRQNPCETRNGAIKTRLQLLLDGEAHHSWEEKIPSILFALRNSRNEATRFAPSELLLGSLLKRPGDWDYPVAHSATHSYDSSNTRSHFAPGRPPEMGRNRLRLQSPLPEIESPRAATSFPFNRATGHSRPLYTSS
ncbi:hypothetical protein M8J77_003912 [Diaphorina citri]|nr:hypothetical protein M8J77_003912 [Diaphorina citri]